MHRTDGAGHVNNMFVEQDLVAGLAPTELTMDWFNAVQEELAAPVLEFVGALNKSDNGQLLKAIIAAQGNNRDVLIVTGNITLTAADVGKLIVGGSATPFTVTLPLTNAVRPGAKFECVNMNAGAMTIQCQGTTDIINTSSTRTFEVLGTGDSLVVHAKPTLNMWYASGGTNQFAYAAKFKGLYAANGYQTLPGGFLFQWMRVTPAAGDEVYNWPIPFPTVCFGANGTSEDATPLIITSNPTQNNVRVRSRTTAGAGLAALTFVFGIGI